MKSQLRTVLAFLAISLATCQIIVAETLGPSLVPRSSLDGGSDYLFLNTSGFTQSGLVQSWSFYNDTAGSGNRTLEPLILQLQGSNWVVTGRGAAVTTPATPPGVQNYAFSLVSGSAVVGPSYSFAHHDLGNPGSIQYDDGGSFQYYFYGNTPVPVSTSIPSGSFAGGRTYSEQFTSTQVYNNIWGNAIIDRPLDDSVVGALFGVVNTPFRGELTEWSFFDNDSSGSQITPLIIQRDAASGSNSYQVVGLGTTRTSTGLGAQSYGFGLVAGTTVLNENRFLGFVNANPNTLDANAGVIDYTDAVSDAKVIYFGSPTSSPLTPASFLNREYSIQSTQVTVSQVVGNGLASRSNTDGASGSIFVVPTELKLGELTEWSLLDRNASLREITPLLVELVAGNYVIRGIGATQTSTSNIGQAFSFGLLSGIDTIGGPNYYFAWKDGGNGSDNQGVIDWDASAANTIVWLGGSKTSFTIGSSYGPSGVLGRTYSVQALVVPEPSSATLLLFGLAGLGLIRRRKSG